MKNLFESIFNTNADRDVELHQVLTKLNQDLNMRTPAKVVGDVIECSGMSLYKKGLDTLEPIVRLVSTIKVGTIHLGVDHRELDAGENFFRNIRSIDPDDRVAIECRGRIVFRNMNFEAKTLDVYAEERIDFERCTIKSSDVTLYIDDPQIIHKIRWVYINATGETDTLKIVVDGRNSTWEALERQMVTDNVIREPLPDFDPYKFFNINPNFKFKRIVIENRCSPERWQLSEIILSKTKPKSESGSIITKNDKWYCQAFSEAFED